MLTVTDPFEPRRDSARGADLWGDTGSHRPDGRGPMVLRVASTDGLGGKVWLERFLIWHGAVGVGIVGTVVAPSATAKATLVAIGVGGMIGAANTWRWWLRTWRRVAASPRE